MPYDVLLFVLASVLAYAGYFYNNGYLFVVASIAWVIGFVMLLYYPTEE